jgi:hypothetical protein
MDMNVSFEYLYRDGSNYKNWGEVVLTTTSKLPIADLERQIQQGLIDGGNFVAEELCIPTLYFETKDVSVDHGWHEYASVSHTERPTTIAKSIEDLIERLVISKRKNF